jgi:DNA-binding transcriptional MerR regulator
LIRRIRDLLYEQGFTISGARNRLTEAAQHGVALETEAPQAEPSIDVDAIDLDEMIEQLQAGAEAPHEIPQPEVTTVALSLPQMRQELISIRGLLLV